MLGVLWQMPSRSCIHLSRCLKGSGSRHDLGSGGLAGQNGVMSMTLCECTLVYQPHMHDSLLMSEDDDGTVELR